MQAAREGLERGAGPPARTRYCAGAAPRLSRVSKAESWAVSVGVSGARKRRCDTSTTCNPRCRGRRSSSARQRHEVPNVHRAQGGTCKPLPERLKMATVRGETSPCNRRRAIVGARHRTSTTAARQHPVGAVAKSAQVDFEVVLKLHDASGAESLVRAISSPGSASYRHYLTASQWESRFSPTTSEVSSARAWLASEGF